MNPAKEPGTADAILKSQSLSKQQKIDALRQLAYDARELHVATDEGMQGAAPPPASRLPEIQRALRSLGVTDTESDHKQ